LQQKTIQLTSPIARLVVKDLIKFDSQTDEMKLMQSILTSTNDKLLTQTDLVSNLKIQNANLESIIVQKTQQMDAQKKISDEFKKAYEKERRTKKLYKLGTTIGAAAVGLLLIQK